MTSPSVEVTTGRGAESERVGEVHITFYADRRFDIKLEGQVTTGSLQRCRRSLYRAANVNRVKLRHAKLARSKVEEAKLAAAEAKVAAQAEKVAAKRAKKGDE